jgi:hypothetical protein
MGNGAADVSEGFRAADFSLCSMCGQGTAVPVIPEFPVVKEDSEKKTGGASAARDSWIASLVTAGWC